jgi:hypothetical protein
MNNLVPRDSLFQDLFDFRRDFDQIFNRMVSGWPFGETRTASSAGTYHNGMLEIAAPVAAAALPRRIEVRTTPMAKQIGA